MIASCYNSSMSANLNPKQLLERLGQAQTLLDSDATSKAKFNALRKLIKGANPELDRHLLTISKTLTQIDQFQQGKIINLTAAHLPSQTKEQKRRKKLLLLLLRQWRQLNSEVERLQLQRRHHRRLRLSQQSLHHFSNRKFRLPDH